MKGGRFYESPFVERYSTQEMLYNFSAHKKYTTWRRLWVALAEAERELGLNITKKQIQQMKRYVNKINYDVAKKFEMQFRHEVMAHIHAYAKQCPTARPIIHLGATSAYLIDNTDLILIRDGLEIIRKKLLSLIFYLLRFAKRYASFATLAYTHLQPAQLTTIGKRACLWLYDLLMDYKQCHYLLKNLRFLGTKGATGTQASFLKLFGNRKKVFKIDGIIAKKMGFEKIYQVSGQTYPRKVDSQVHQFLANIAQSACKFSNDLRLLQHMGEMQEPFGKKQVGSSAMPYKKNPVLSERIASLGRFVISIAQNAVFTAAGQFFERTLDDSAGKRITLPEAFLAVDGILEIYLYIIQNLKINKDVIKKNVQRYIHLMATENILMEAVKKGGDRQKLHERLKKYSLSSKGSLFESLKRDKHFKHIDIEKYTDTTQYIGVSPQQVERFLKTEVEEVLKGNKKFASYKARVTI
jgi:adenylosuccinate lyase